MINHIHPTIIDFTTWTAQEKQTRSTAHLHSLYKMVSRNRNRYKSRAILFH